MHAEFFFELLKVRNRLQYKFVLCAVCIPAAGCVSAKIGKIMSSGKIRLAAGAYLSRPTLSIGMIGKIFVHRDDV